MKFCEYEFDAEAIAAINSILDSELTSDDLVNALENQTPLCNYDDPMVLQEDFIVALSDVMEEGSLDYHVNDIIRTVIEPHGDVTEYMKANDRFFYDERLNDNHFFSTFGLVSIQASDALMRYERILKLLSLPTQLMQELSKKIEGSKLYTSDGRHFYFDLPNGESYKIRFADHSFKSGAGKLHGHHLPDLEFVWSYSGSEDELSGATKDFWQRISNLLTISFDS